MKKIVILLISLLLMSCTNTSNVPSKKVEEFFSKYQNMDSSVLTQLEAVVNNDYFMNDEEKAQYIALMKRQYQNLSYKIDSEEVTNTGVIVKTTIEVYDYAKSVRESEKYYLDHPEEFSSDINSTLYLDYKIKNMVNTNDKIKYNIDFYLRKDNNTWELSGIGDIDLEKIHGLMY